LRGRGFDDRPRHHDDPRRFTRQNVAARWSAAKQIGQRTGEVTCDPECPRTLSAIGQHISFAEQAGYDQTYCRGRVARSQKRFVSDESAQPKMGCDDREVGHRHGALLRHQRVPPTTISGGQ
jgi:hypothetical protein